MVDQKLSNERFVQNANPEVVAKERQKQTDYQTKYEATNERIAKMGEVGGDR